MAFSTSRLALCAVAAGVLTTLAGCSGPDPDGSPPPPPPAASYQPAQPAAPMDLAGAPPSRPADGLAGGPRNRDRPPVFTSMAPIANPEDMSPAERHRIYGSRYDRAHAAGRAHGPRRDASAHHGSARHAVTGHAAARPAPVHAAPAPVAAKPVAKTAPALTRTPAGSAAIAPLDPTTARLQTALAAPVAAASTLTVAPAIRLGQPGAVDLALPPALLDMIRQQGAKLGLGRAARGAEVSATLSGTGYDITPGGPQVAKLANGVASKFQWQVTPQPGAAHSGLRANVQTILHGERKPRVFPLATLDQPGVAAAPAASSGGFDLGKLNIGGVTLPASSRSLIGIAMVGAALLLLLILATRAAETKTARTKRRRQRQFRTMADYGAMDDKPDTAPPAGSQDVVETANGDEVARRDSAGHVVAAAPPKAANEVEQREPDKA